MDYFHRYTFNVLRQLGANFELLAAHCRWLQAWGEEDLTEAVTACEQLSTTAKALQFQLARVVTKKKAVDFSSVLDTLEGAHDTALGVLLKRYG